VASDAGLGSAQITDTRLDDATGGGAGLSDAPADGSRPGLPRRLRQASHPPHLGRKFSFVPAAPGRGPRRPSPVTEEPAERSPQEAGSMLSALQAGWERARIKDLD